MEDTADLSIEIITGAPLVFNESPKSLMKNKNQKTYLNTASNGGCMEDTAALDHNFRYPTLK